MTDKPSRGTLALAERHPAAEDAKQYLSNLDIMTLSKYIEAFASTAIEGNRLGDVCGETLRRIMNGEPVSDRYVLGLAWTIKGMEGVT